MAVKLFFGLPGSGKTTLMAYFAKKATRKRSKYTNVYSNIPLQIKGVTIISNEHIGNFQLENGLLLIDEATLFADSRDYKSFDKARMQFFLLHRHYNVDIYLFTQQWDAVDRKIRVITDRVYYVFKGPFLGKWYTSYYRIPYGIIIPDPNKKGGTSGEKLGEIIQGYCKPHFLVRLFCTKLYRPKYYKYFDSWSCPKLPKLPPNVVTVSKDPPKVSLRLRLHNLRQRFLAKFTKKDNVFSSDQVSDETAASLDIVQNKQISVEF